jgi:hypothetical protein
MLDTEYDLVRLVAQQRDQIYNFGDILAARAGTRASVTRIRTPSRASADIPATKIRATRSRPLTGCASAGSRPAQRAWP